MYLKKFLRAHSIQVGLATLIALLLGATTALLGTLIGPVVSSMLDSEAPVRDLNPDELFGTLLGTLLTWIFDLKSVRTTDLIGNLAPLLIAVASARAFLAILHWFMWERLGEKLSLKLRNDFATSFLNTGSQRLLEDKNLSSNIATLLSMDVRLIREYLIRFYGGLPREGLQVVFLAITLSILSPQLFMLFVFVVAPLILAARRFGKSLKKRTAAALGSYDETTEWLQQRMLGVETIKHMRSERYESEQMIHRNRELCNRLIRMESIKAWTSPIIEFVSVVAVAIVVAVALHLIRSGTMNSNVQFSFFANLALLSQSASKLGKYFNSHREAKTAVVRLATAQKSYVSDTVPNSIQSAEDRLIFPEILRCKDLSFAYTASGRVVFNGFNQSFLAGRFYVLAGPSGSGKTTLFRLMLKLIQPTSGHVLWGEELSRDGVGYLPQKLGLPVASLGLSISYPDNQYDAKKLRSAMEDAGLGQLSKSIDLDASLEDLGRKLSGGEMQRVHLARLLYHRYSIWLIDEGTAALDHQNEQNFLQLVKNLCATKGLCVVMIAHRQQPLEYADEVISFGVSKFAEPLA